MTEIEKNQKVHKEVFHGKLHELQKAIRVPKNEVNKFGGFKYRTAEQILEQARAVLPDGVAITLSDDLIFDENYRPIAIKATASILYCDDCCKVFGYALLGTHKGMSAEQATGTASSYARKYALCGLLAIGDGSIDPDAIENEPKAEPKTKQQPKQSRADIVKGRALKLFWDKWNETGKTEDVADVAKELFEKCQNDEDMGAVMAAKEEFDIHVDSMLTSEHEDAGDRV